MADKHGLALQKALISSLKANADVSELVAGRVYDEPPQDATRPFIRLGGLEVRPLRSDAKKAAIITFSMEAHSRPNAGRVEATRCAEAIVDALDGQPLTVAGYTAVTMQFRAQTVEYAGDGKSYSAIVAFTTIIDG